MKTPRSFKTELYQVSFGTAPFKKVYIQKLNNDHVNSFRTSLALLQWIEEAVPMRLSAKEAAKIVGKALEFFNS